MLVSVIMPAYNCEKYIGQAIESVINQTYENWELIIVDDCSCDGTLAVAKEYAKKDSRIHVLPIDKNQGVANARNTGIKAASGQCIALFDSDDVWLESKLEQQINLMLSAKAEIVYCSYGFIDENNANIKRPFIVPKQTNYRKMLVNCVISCSTALIDAQLLKTHLFKREFYVEDYVLWMELLSLPVTAVGCPEVLAYYRQVMGSRSSRKGNAAKERWNVYRKVLKLSFPVSVWYFTGYAIKSIMKYYL